MQLVHIDPLLSATFSEEYRVKTLGTVRRFKVVAADT